MLLDRTVCCWIEQYAVFMHYSFHAPRFGVVKTDLKLDKFSISIF